MALDTIPTNYKDEFGEILVNDSGAISLKLNRVILWPGSYLDKPGISRKVQKDYPDAQPQYAATVYAPATHAVVVKEFATRYVLTNCSLAQQAQLAALKGTYLPLNKFRAINKQIEGISPDDVVLRASANINVPIAYKRGQEVSDPVEISKLFYPGCIVDLVVSHFYRERRDIGLGYNLLAINFADDGEPIKTKANPLQGINVSRLFGGSGEEKKPDSAVQGFNLGF